MYNLYVYSICTNISIKSVNLSLKQIDYQQLELFTRVNFFIYENV